MAVIRSKVQLTLGPIAATVDVLSAIKAPPRNITVCTGDGAHEPTKIQLKRHCPECGDVHDSTLVKAREVADGLVIPDQDVIKSLAPEPVTAMTLNAHPAKDVELHSATGTKVYWLRPVGNGDTYQALVQYVKRHPAVALTFQWAPRTNTAMFVLREKDGALLAQERVPTTNLHPAPEIDEAPASKISKYARIINQVVEANEMVTPFTPSAFGEHTAVEEYIATLTPIAVGKVADVTNDADDLFKALEASVKNVKARKVKASA